MIKHYNFKNEGHGGQKLPQPKIELNNNKWFSTGIGLPTFPSFESSVLKKLNLGANISNPIEIGIDEELLGLFCIGGTQAAKVAVKEFKPIIEGGNVGYEATIILQYLDTFGVSESDYTKNLGIIGITNLTEYNYRGGVLAQWILQPRSRTNPFVWFVNKEQNRMVQKL